MGTELAASCLEVLSQWLSVLVRCLKLFSYVLVILSPFPGSSKMISGV